MKISCYLIGEDSLLIQCGNLLLSRNHHIAVVISPTQTIQDWARKNNILYLSNLDNLMKLKLTKTDYIFSVVNSRILSNNVLNLARKGTINYHDSPLPKYAGVNSTTWAIINGENKHGITWHKVTDKLDEGEIIEQHVFPIKNEDTAFTLNLRCYEQAIKSFERLLTNIEQDNLLCEKQNLQKKHYFGVGHVVPNFGFIDWVNFTADFIIKISRALTFGHYNNNVGTLKISVNNHYLIIVNVEYSFIQCYEGCEPGTVLAVQEDGLHISTIKQAIKINLFISATGIALTVEEVINRYNIGVGFKFSEFNTQYSATFKTIYSNALKNEHFWVKQIKNITEHATFSHQSIKKNKKIKKLNSNIFFSDQLKLVDISTQKNSVLAAILIYLFRLNNYDKMAVSILHQDHTSFSNQFGNLFSCALPMVIDWHADIILSEVINDITKKNQFLAEHKTYLTDIVARHPCLESNRSDPEIIIDLTENPISTPFIANSSAILYFQFNLKSHEVCVYHRIEKNYQGGELSNVLLNLTKHITTILDTILNNPHFSVGSFCFLTPSERHKLLIDWGRGKEKPIPNQSIPSLFEKQARKYPNNLAVIMDSETISYHELWILSEKIAVALRLLNLPKQTLIGIYIHRSIEMIAIILGILKADCVYVPLDTKYPILKIETIINTANLAYVMTSNSLMDNITPYINTHLKVFFYPIEEVLSEKNVLDNVPLRKNQKHGNKLAYIMFTSGTTGTPKGVMVTQHNIINYCQWFSETTQFNTSSIIDFSSSIAFDLSVPCTIAPLLVGGCMAICNDMNKTNPQSYLNYLIKNKITHVELTPGYMEILLNYPELIKKLIDLKVLLLGADIVLSSDVSKWLTLCPFHQIVNEYGPTETTVSATSYFINKDMVLNEASVPIGRPAFNTSCYILDKKGNLCPDGIKGELCIGGAQVTSGYLENVKLTKEKFINTTFCYSYEVIYKTGDLVCWLADGNLQFFGRNDCQVKIHGYRIELSEIESALLKIPAIHQAIVIMKQGHFREKYLRAYLVLHHQQDVSTVEIKNFLSLYLPTHMIPKEFCITQTIPLKENEKIDFKSLEKQKYTLLVAEHKIDSEITAVEENILRIWKNVFNDNSIKMHEDFFELGGDSLLALQIIAELKKHYYSDVPLHYLFEFPTVSLLSNKLTELTDKIVTSQISSLNKRYTTLVKLSSGNGSPIFLVHPVGGSVFWYKNLSSYLNGGYTVYGIQDPSIDGSALRFKTLEDMASYYLKEIESVYVGENYYIGGASFGATVAFEMAHQLVYMNKEIVFLGFFDGWAKYSDELLKENTTQLLCNNENNISTISDEKNKYLSKLEEYRKQLLINYKLVALDANAYLFKAIDLWSYFLNLDDNHNGWKSFITGKLTTYKVPGSHETIFFDSNVDVLAKYFMLSLKRKM